MIERIIENWLTNSTEKTFQIPFCYILANEGYTVVHLTRHCGMEHGKDVIAINPNGEICAYQLKNSNGGKIKLKYYQETLLSQIMQLVFTPVSHPSVPFPNTHQSYFVTNGELEEEVFREIDAFNKDWVLKGQPQFQLKTILKGDLLLKALYLKTDLIPSEVKDYTLLIDFHLNDGTGILDKNKFSKLIEGHFEKHPTGEAEAKRIISSGALLCSLATASFTNRNNHIAIIEAWTIYLSYLLRFCEIHSIPSNIYKNELLIGEEIIRNGLESLIEEISLRTDYLEGSKPEDAFIYRFRLTWLIGFTSYLGIYYRIRNNNSDKVESIKKFVDSNASNLELWGESGLPSLLMHYWFKKQYRLENASSILKQSIDLILDSLSKSDTTFTSPYEDIETSLSFLFGDEKVKENIYQLQHESYYLWSLILLLVKEGEREFIESKWPRISAIFFKYFKVASPLDTYRWKNSHGQDVSSHANTPESWKNLITESQTFDDLLIPKLLKEHFWFAPLFFLVYPHRVSKDFILTLDNVIMTHT